MMPACWSRGGDGVSATQTVPLSLEVLFGDVSNNSDVTSCLYERQIEPGTCCRYRTTLLPSGVPKSVYVASVFVPSAFPVCVDWGLGAVALFWVHAARLRCC